MLAANGVNIIRITTFCIILPAVFAQSNNKSASEKRSLNNYVATSVPYTVEGHHAHQNELSLTDIISGKVDGALVSQDVPAQDMLDCVDENHCVNNVTTNDHSSAEGTFRPFSQDELNKILQKYENEKDNLEAQETSNKVANYYSVANPNNIETLSSSSENDKSKAWNLISHHQQQQQQQQQQPNYNKNPYDDRMGWVTLEPIAWSSSQVQKWEPNTKPSWPIPSNNGPWGSPSHYQQQSTYDGYSDRPYKKPTYQYQSKPWNANQNYAKPQYQGSFGNQEIITDGQPGYFPSPPSSPAPYKPWLESTQSISYIDNGNRPATHVVYQGIGTSGASHQVPDRQPAPASSADGEGHWVLLSSTKGYSVPHRERNFGRSLDTVEENAAKPETKDQKNARPLSARRSIRLTVLPSLNGPSSTVTSHNGMIEVESTHQTVDEAHREHLARMMRFGNATKNEVHTIRSSSFHGIPAKVEAVARPAERRNTLLGTVSAGMLPATMAMILPMLMGRRKRSLEPQILTFSIRNFNQPGTFTTFHNKPVKDIVKRKILY